MNAGKASFSTSDLPNESHRPAPSCRLVSSPTYSVTRSKMRAKNSKEFTKGVEGQRDRPLPFFRYNIRTARGRCGLFLVRTITTTTTTTIVIIITSKTSSERRTSGRRKSPRKAKHIICTPSLCRRACIRPPEFEALDANSEKVHEKQYDLLKNNRTERKRNSRRSRRREESSWREISSKIRM